MEYRVEKVKIGEEVETPGVDMGPKPTLWAKSFENIALKTQGHMAWAGRGEQSYYATRFIVLKILEDDGKYWKCKEIIEFPIRTPEKW